MENHKPHPIAALFPPMSEAELDALTRDIKANGLRHPIVLLDDLVLDGRHRQIACERAGKPPKFINWKSGGQSPVEYVISENFNRRHLTESQKAMVAAKALKLIEKEGKARSKANLKKGSKAPESDPGHTRGRLAAVLAAPSGISARTVARARAVLENAPAVEVEAIERGDKTVKQVERELKRADQVEQAKAYEPPAGEYPVIVIDPPWAYEDQLDGSDAARGGTPYPTMTIEQIADLELPLAKDAALFLWVTNSHLIDPEAYAVVAAAWKGTYGLVPKQIRTWVKPRMGLGRYWRNDTEHLVLFVRGRPVFASVTQTTSLHAPLAGHSTKPQQAFDDIDAMCPAGPKLEMFARAPRPGWVTSGSELAVEPKPPMFIDTPAGQAAVAALNAGMAAEPPKPIAAKKKRKLTGAP